VFIGLREFVRSAVRHDQEGTRIDGKGGVQRNVVVSVEGSKIARIESSGAAKSTYDLSALTLMPGWINTHAHPNTHFDKNNRFVDGHETVSRKRSMRPAIY
jgi:imidazolonepropionase-like amidohydrolase